MQDSQMGLRKIEYREVFPWVHLFRAFRIAIDVRKIILASLALVVLALGNWAFQSLPFAPEKSEGFPRPWDEPLGYAFFAGAPVAEEWNVYPNSPVLFEFPTPIESLIADPRTTLWTIGTNWAVVLRPLSPLIEPARVLFRSNDTWGEVAYAWTRLLWALVVWSLFAGAVTRMAAIQFARNESVSMASAVWFSGRKFLSYLSAPLLPVGGIIACWLLCVLTGLVGRIPSVGEAVVGFLGLIPLVFGLLIVLLLLGVAAGWPLMLATISAEGTDAFDGFSRSYSYVYSRPWHYLWLAVVMLAYGSAAIFFVWMMVSLTASLTQWGVGAGMEASEAERLFQAAPSMLELSPEVALPLPEDHTYPEPAAVPPVQNAGAAPEQNLPLATRFMGVWLAILGLLVNGFVYSYFWSAVTIIYFLLRRSDDATNLDEVYVIEDDDQDDLLPVVGVADTDHPVIERPPGVIPQDKNDG